MFLNKSYWESYVFLENALNPGNIFSPINSNYSKTSNSFSENSVKKVITQLNLHLVCGNIVMKRSWSLLC